MIEPTTIFEACGRHVPGGEVYFAPKPVDKPTDTPPGSEARIREMCRRAELGMDLFDPRDKTDLADPHDYRTGHEGVTWFGFGIDRDYQPRFQKVSSPDDDS